LPHALFFGKTVLPCARQFQPRDKSLSPAISGVNLDCNQAIRWTPHSKDNTSCSLPEELSRETHGSFGIG